MPTTESGGDEPVSIGRTGLVYLVPIYDHAVLADRKATFILTFSGLLLTVLAFFAPRMAGTAGTWSARQTALAVAVAVDVAFIVTAAVIAYRGYVRPMPPPPPGTLAFFRDIAACPAKEYGRAVTSLGAAGSARAMLHYNHSAATLAAMKFRLINRSLRWLRAGLLLWMVLLLALAIR
jgi:hypothetical protein